MAFPITMGLAGILAFVAFLCVLAHWEYSTEPVVSSDNLPWAGVRDELFRMTRASFRQFQDSSQTIADGYAQFSKQSRAFFVPDMSFKSQLLLPQEYIKWLIAQPDSMLSVYKVRNERHAFKYLSNSIDHKVTIKILDNIVGRCLTKNLHYTQADMLDEIRASVDYTMGLDEKWHEVNLQQTMKTVADRTGSRALFGLPLCRDLAFLHNMDRFVVLMGVGMVVVGQIPWLVRPFLGAMVNIPLRIYKARILRILVPLVKGRMQEYEQREHSGSLKDESNDFVTQAVKLTMQRKDRSIFDDPKILAEQFLLLAFGGLSTNALVGTNVFLDILTMATELNVYDTLRDEAARAFPSETDWSDPAALATLVLADSTIRESLRIMPINARGLLREVMPQGGLILPDGNKVPRGTWIGAPVQAAHMDDRFYDRPDQYDPFRFTKTMSENDRLDATQTSDTFLRWGHGRSACPGRWFATQELKLLIAYITLNHDIEPIHERPQSVVFGDNSWTSHSACIKVRRRKHN